MVWLNPTKETLVFELLSYFIKMHDFMSELEVSHADLKTQELVLSFIVCVCVCVY